MDKIGYIILLILFIIAVFLGFIVNMNTVIAVSSFWSGYYLHEILYGRK